MSQESAGESACPTCTTRSLMPMPMTSIEELEDELSRPSKADVESLRQLEGDILILGAAGKMGPSLARLCRRAADAAGPVRRILAVSRRLISAPGIDAISCDLLDRAQVARLPECPNVLYLAGRKFGSSDRPELTWAMNTVVPAGRRCGGAGAAHPRGVAAADLRTRNRCNLLRSARSRAGGAVARVSECALSRRAEVRVVGPSRTHLGDEYRSAGERGGTLSPEPHRGVLHRNVYAPRPVAAGGSRETDPPAPVGEYAQSCLGRERA